MALKTQTKFIPVVGGMDESTDQAILQTGKLLSAKNVRFKKDGVAQRRPGVTQVSASSDLTGGFGASVINAGEGRLISDGSRLLLADGNALHAYSLGPKKWSTKSLLPRWTGTSRSVGGSNKMLAQHVQCAATDGTNGYTVVAYVEHQDSAHVFGSLIVRVFNSSTLAEVNTTGLQPNVAPANTFQANLDTNYVHCPQLVPVGTKVVLMYAGGTNNKIYYHVLDCTTMAWGAESAIITDNSALAGTNSSFDAKPVNASKLALVYQTSGWLIKAQRYSVSGTTITLADNVTVQDRSAQPIPLASGFGVRHGNTYTWVTWGIDDNTRVCSCIAAVNTGAWTVAALSASVTQYTNLREANGDYIVASCSITDPLDDTGCYFGYTHICGWSGGNLASDMSKGHVHYGTMWHKAHVSGGTIIYDGPKATFGRAKIVSTPVYDSTVGRLFVVMERNSGFHVANAQIGVYGNNSYPTTPAANIGSKAPNAATTFLGDIVNGVEDAVFFPRSSYTTTDAGATQFYTYKLAVQYLDSVQLRFTVSTVDQQYKRASVNVVTLTKADQYRYHWHDSEEGVYLSCGFPGYIDGRSYSPLGFLYDPGYVTVASGGAGAVSGTCTVVYEYVDRDGNVQRSDVATPATFSGTSTFAIHAPLHYSGWDQLLATNRGFAQPVGGVNLVFYAGPDINSMREFNRLELLVQQETFAQYGTQGVSSAASSLPSGETSPFVYTYGGFLPADCPPAFISMTEFGGRLFGLDHTQRTIWFSKAMVRGERAQFSLEQTIDVPFDAESVFNLDGTLFIFGRNSIGYFMGDGPNDSGDGGGFDQISIMASDLGCSESRSIVRTPNGLMFKSPIGFQQLDKSSKVNFVGSEVLSLVAQYPNVRCGLQHPTDNVVMWACDNGSSGIRLVYNYLFDRWSYDTVNSGQIIQSMVGVGSSLYILTTDGSVWIEDSSIGTDNGTFFPAELVFASEKPAGVEALHRFRCAELIGKRLGNCDITVSVAFDDADSYTYSQTFQASDLTSNDINFQMYPARQLGRSIRVKVTDAFPTGAGAAYNNGLGVKFVGIGLEFGAYESINRVDSGKRK